MSAKPLKSKSTTTISRQSTIHLPRVHRLHEHEKDSEISRRATGTMSKLSKRAWGNKYLTERTKMHMYQACVLSKLFHGSETWTTYTRQKHRLNTFYLRCLRRILGVKCQEHITNSETLSRAETPSMCSILSPRRLRWLGHTHRMDASPRKTYTDNGRPESNKSGALFCGSRTQANVTSKHAKFIQTTQKIPRVIVPAGDGQRMR